MGVRVPWEVLVFDRGCVCARDLPSDPVRRSGAAGISRSVLRRHCQSWCAIWKGRSRSSAAAANSVIFPLFVYLFPFAASLLLLLVHTTKTRCGKVAASSSRQPCERARAYRRHRFTPLVPSRTHAVRPF